MAAARPKVRESLAVAIREEFGPEFLQGLARDIKEMTKGAWGAGTCPECGSQKKVRVDVPDVQGMLKAVTELMEQAEGRPGTASGEPGGVTLIVERTWPAARAEDPDKLHPAPSPGDLSPIAG